MSTTLKTIVGLGLGIVFLRLLTVLQTGLMPQDAYYHFYGRHLALSYFDHPPMIAYLLRAATQLFGRSVVVLKLTDYAVTALTLFCFYRLAKLHLRPLAALFTTVAFGSTLLITVLSINSTPDVPLLLFWTLSVWGFHRAVFTGKIVYWALAGLAMGLAFSSKYTALFLLVGVGVFLVLSPRYRHYLLSLPLALLLAGFLLGAAPVLVWNYLHDASSFAFQSSDRASRIMELDLDIPRFLASQGLQLLLLLPPLFLLMYAAFFRSARSAFRRRRLPEEKTLFLLAFSVPSILLFLTVGTVYWIKLNWMMPAYVTGAVLAGRFLTAQWLRYQLIGALLLHLLFFVQVTFYLVPIKSDDTWVGWPQLADEARNLKAKYPDHFLFSNDDYKTSAVLDFYLDEPVYGGNVIGDNGKQFAVVYPELAFLGGRNAIYLDSDKRMRDSLPHPTGIPVLEAYFEQVRQLPPLLIRDESGRLLRKFHVFECREYRSVAATR